MLFFFFFVLTLGGGLKDSMFLMTFDIVGKIEKIFNFSYFHAHMQFCVVIGIMIFDI